MILISFISILSGSTAENSLKFWQAFGLDVPIAPGFKLYFEKQIRYEEKFTNLDSDFNELGIRYRLNKFLSFRLNYRYVSLSGNEIRHRFDGNTQINFKIKNFTVSNRFRLQHESIEDFDGNYSELEFRDRLRVSFNLSKKIRPYFGGEIFLGIGDDATNQNKYRLIAGTNWKIKKRVTIKLFYHFQKELQNDNPDSSHIFGLKFNYSF